MTSKTATGATAPVSALPPLGVWCADTEEGAPLLRALEEGRRLTEYATPPAMAPDDMLLLHLSPGRAIARALMAGATPAAALADWKAQATPMLRLSRSDRRRIQVLDIAMAYAVPGAFRSRWGLPDGPGPVAPRNAAKDDPLLVLLGERILMADPESRRLMSEIEAVSISLTGRGAPAPALDAAVASYRDLRSSGDRRDALTRDLASAESAMRLLQAQNTTMQEELEGLIRSRIELDEARAEADRLRREIDDMYRSHSFRVTAPLRRIRGLLSARRA